MTVEGKEEWFDPIVYSQQSSLLTNRRSTYHANTNDLNICHDLHHHQHSLPARLKNNIPATSTTTDINSITITPYSLKRRVWKFVFLLGVTTVAGVILHQVFIEKRNDCFLLDQEIQFRWKRLEGAVKKEIFGQHLAVDAALNALFAHLTDPEPPKALVLAFHGWHGSGKTFLSNIIAKNLYKGGFQNPHVKVFIGPRHFLLDPALLSRNQAKLTELIEKTMKVCKRSLFIFDEVDKMPHEILDALSPFIGYQGPIDGVEYRHGIFIFLSNTGAQKVNNITLDALRIGREREDLKMEEFKDVFVEGTVEEPSVPAIEVNKSTQVSSLWQDKVNFLYSTWQRISNFFIKSCNCSITETPFLMSMKLPPGGLIGSEILQKRLVDHFLPFLPLQKKHILLCVKREMHRRYIINVDPMKIANRLNYFPPGEHIFARDGCKNIPSHVSHYINHAQNVFTK